MAPLHTNRLPAARKHTLTFDPPSPLKRLEQMLKFAPDRPYSTPEDYEGWGMQFATMAVSCRLSLTFLAELSLFCAQNDVIAAGILPEQLHQVGDSALQAIGHILPRTLESWPEWIHPVLRDAGKRLMAKASVATVAGPSMEGEVEDVDMDEPAPDHQQHREQLVAATPVQERPSKEVRCLLGTKLMVCLRSNLTSESRPARPKRELFFPLNVL